MMMMMVRTGVQSLSEGGPGVGLPPDGQDGALDVGERLLGARARRTTQHLQEHCMKRQYQQTTQVRALMHAYRTQ
jgi:hypothetical protein